MLAEERCALSESYLHEVRRTQGLYGLRILYYRHKQYQKLSASERVAEIQLQHNEQQVQGQRRRQGVESSYGRLNFSLLHKNNQRGAYLHFCSIRASNFLLAEKSKVNQDSSEVHFRSHERNSPVRQNILQTKLLFVTNIPIYGHLPCHSSQKDAKYPKILEDWRIKHNFAFVSRRNATIYRENKATKAA